MTLAPEDLLVASRPDTLVDRFLKENDFPVIDRKGVTFFYRGEAEAVELIHWVHGLQTARPFQRLNGTDLWFHRLELPRGSRMEYKFNVVRGGQGRWITDPLNPVMAEDPFGENSVCRAYGYSPPEWTRPDPEARRGTLEEAAIESQALGDTRRLGLYIPARFRRSRRYPLLIVHDGSDYLRYSGLRTALDNLIHRLEIPPMIVALTDSPARLMEYSGNYSHARFVSIEVPEWIQSHFPLRPDASSRGLMGASFGAVAALHAAWHHPGRFGQLLLQSGSFAFTDIGRNRRGPTFEPVVAFVNAFRRNPGAPAERAFVSCGIYESLIYENRSLLPVLQKSMEVRFSEAPDGHNWENWRDRLREGLSWLFPGPLWMVYE